jgi:ketosteroid isomerase-like protein
MKKCRLALCIVLMVGMAGVAFAQNSKDQKSEQQEKEKIMSSREKNLEVMRQLFRAVEQHDEQSVVGLYQPDVEFHWPPPLPYGGSHHGLRSSGPTWGETWALLQPTEAERKMDPRVVAASDDEVVVLWQQRGISAAGERFDGEVLGLYRLRDGKLARAQMFYFDTTAVNSFLAKAITPELRQKSQAVFDQLKRLPEERQLAVRQAYWKLQTMSPEEWRRELNSARLANAFPEEERDLLDKLLSLNTKRGEWKGVEAHDE